MNKQDFVKSLKKVKLVIGNGFDLHCYLKSSYADFFHYDEIKNDYFYKWMDDFAPHAIDYLQLHVKNHNESWVEFLQFEKTNVWDFFFYLVSRQKDVDIKKWKWCDIETQIEYSLSDRQYGNTPQWSDVFEIIERGCGTADDDFALLILASVVFKKHNEVIFTSQKQFYSFLLEQLKIFEKGFGKYIFRQHCDDTNKKFGIYIDNEAFKCFSKDTVDVLCAIKNIVSVDSFNYDFIEIEDLRTKFRNINGNIESPIFGIDSDIFPYSDPRHIFSKTNRRMELDMFDDEAADRTEFENIVIFGHSLNKADYNYFFSIFDKIDITNMEKNSKVVFAFSVYDPEKEYEIKADLRRSIFRIFYDYSIYKGKEKFPNKMLDLLTTQGKVIMYEIPVININWEPDYFRK